MNTLEQGERLKVINRAQEFFDIQQLDEARRKKDEQDLVIFLGNLMSGKLVLINDGKIRRIWSLEDRDPP